MVSMNTHTDSSALIQLPHELINAINNIYLPAGMKVTGIPKRETQSEEYSACRFELDGQKVIFRVAKTTPTKIGQFVTLWKRQNAADKIAPFDINDEISHVVVTVFDQTHQGQFVFNKKILSEKGVISSPTKEGKRAIRVYPPWTKPIAKQAIKTQQWQLQYFFAIENNGCADLALVKALFSH